MEARSRVWGGAGTAKPYRTQSPSDAPTEKPVSTTTTVCSGRSSLSLFAVPSSACLPRLPSSCLAGFAMTTGLTPRRGPAPRLSPGLVGVVLLSVLTLFAPGNVVDSGVAGHGGSHFFAEASNVANKKGEPRREGREWSDLRLRCTRICEPAGGVVLDQKLGRLCPGCACVRAFRG